MRKIIKKDIFLKELENYNEIILIGSGKGVTSVKTINQIGWKRKNLNKYKILIKHYQSAIKNCNNYKFNYMKDPNNPCLFCDIKTSGCAHENELAYASYDSYPVSKSLSNNTKKTY